SSTALTTSSFSSSVNLAGSSTFTLSPGTAGLFFSASVWSPVSLPLSLPSTTLSPGIVSSDPSGYVTVTSPLSPIVIFVPSGNVEFPLSSLLASSTALTTSSFSSSVNLAGSSTVTLSPGTAGLFFSASVWSPVSLPLSLPSPSSTTFRSSSDPSGYVTVTSPLSSTVIFVPSGNVEFPLSSLLASSTALTTSPFSSSVNLVGSSTFTLSPGTFGLFL